MPGRRYNSGSYRYGYNTQEKVLELGEGHYTAEFWEYDSRIGTRWNVDPKRFPGVSPYVVNLDNPIVLKDKGGDCPVCFAILLAGFLTTPNWAIEPTGGPNDKLGIEHARNIHDRWVVYTLLASAMGAGTISP